MKKIGKNFALKNRQAKIGIPMDSLEYFRSLKKPEGIDKGEDRIMTHTFNETIKYLEESGVSFDEFLKMKLHFFKMAGYDAEKGLEIKDEYYKLSSESNNLELDKEK